MDSNIPKSIFYSALDGEFLSIARSSLLYKDFNEKAMELRHIPWGAEKHYPKSLEDMKKRLPILEKKVMKFVLNFIFN